MKLTITQADNGYILDYYNSDIKEKRHIAVEDVDEGKDCISEARLTQKLLLEVMEHFNLFGSKHDAERCYVQVLDKNMKEVE